MTQHTSTMAELSEIVSFCNDRTRCLDIVDFDGAYNGLQIENNGTVQKVGAAVDAGSMNFAEAIRQGVDFLICHHGLFWDKPIPITGPAYLKLKRAMDNNLAVYAAHLPLDCHPEIGNNALLANALALEISGTFIPYQGTDIACIAEAPSGGRAELSARLKRLFPDTFKAIEYGSETPARVAVLTGSGQSAVPHLKANRIDTLITGELRQHHFNIAQELGLNLYPCGHYATEVFGVKALAAEVAERFNLESTFIEQPCPL